MEDLLNVVGNVGFPIAVAAYLLIRIEGKLNELTAAIGSLREAIITLPSGQWSSSRVIQPHPGDNGKARMDDYPTI